MRAECKHGASRRAGVVALVGAAMALAVAVAAAPAAAHDVSKSSRLNEQQSRSAKPKAKKRVYSTRPPVSQDRNRYGPLSETYRDYPPWASDAFTRHEDYMEFD